MVKRNLLGRGATCASGIGTVVGESLDNGKRLIKIRLDGNKGSTWVDSRSVKVHRLGGTAKVDRKRVALASGQEIYLGMKVINSKGKDAWVTGYNVAAPSRYVKTAPVKGSFSGKWVDPATFAKYKAANPVTATVNNYTAKACRLPMLAKATIAICVALTIDHFVFKGAGFDKIKSAAERLICKTIDVVEDGILKK